jgi:serine/threonine-protein kinase
MRGAGTWILVFAAACGGGANGMGGGGGTGGGGGGGGGDDGVDGGNRGGGPAPVGPFFEQPMFFDQNVAGIDPAANSGAIIAALSAAGGWGNNNTFQIDTSINVLRADSTTPHQTFTQGPDWSSPDCDMFDVPVPADGNVEGETGYACTGGGDCHLLVMDDDAHYLYELWEADIEGSGFVASCLARWDTTATYTDTLRGDQCTSADAAGFPIAPMLFTADEVAAGSIDHAIRFILPNDRLQRNYVRPATHGTNTTGGSDAPYYGVHLRLRADYDLSTLPSDGARVVAKALQTYGMYQADGGNIALTARDDRDSTAKWDGLLDSHDLAALKVEDFDVIDHGAAIPLTFDCNR